MVLENNFSSEELANEKWLPIPHYENEYEASSLGRIRTKEGKTTFTERHGVRHWQQRILKQKKCRAFKSKKRYDARVELWKDGKHKTHLVARLIIATFDTRYDLFDKMTVNHIDNNSLNNRIENLEWCTLKVNIQKAFETGIYFQKAVQITDKKTGEIFNFRSLSKGSLYMHQNPKYLSECLRKGKTENLNYKWELLK